MYFLAGNWSLIPEAHTEGGAAVKQEADGAGGKSGTTRSGGAPAGPAENTGMVMYNGSLLDIASVLLRLEKSEKNRQAVEAKLKTTAQEMGK